jgi:hypothetical protein
MTNKEYITDTVDGLAIREKDIDLILRRAKLNAEDDADDRACDKAIYRGIYFVIKRQSFNITEGGYSKTWNENAKAWFSLFCSANGFRNVFGGATARFL